MDFLQSLTQFTWYSAIIRIFLSLILGGCIGMERGFHGRAAGLRTHILVCLGSSMTALTGLYVTSTLAIAGDPFRISAQVISGIGFLGAGTILIRKANVTGLTTAAGLWATAAIGIAVGFGFYVGSVVATVLCLITVTVLTKFEINQKSDLRVYLEINDAANTNFVISKIRLLYGESTREFSILPSKSQIPGNVGMEVSLIRKKLGNTDQIVSDILEIEHVIFSVPQ